MCIIESKTFNALFLRKDGSKSNGPSKTLIKLMNPHFLDLVETRNKYLSLMASKKSEKLQITSKYGYKLVGKLYKAENWNGITVICIHGYRSNGLKEYAFVGYHYLENHYNVLLIDNCASGESEGEYITFGVRESIEGAQWVNKINQLYPESKIVLHGASLGGATVCNMSAMNLKNVIAIIADCPYTSPKDEFMELAKSFTGFRFKFLMNRIEKYTFKKAKFDFSTVTPINSVKNSKFPLLFIHGKSDNYINYSSQDELYNACSSKKEKILFEDAGHCGSQLKEGYFEKIFEFINNFTH